MALQRENAPGTRTKMFSIRLSDAEHKALQQKANSLGVKISRMLVENSLKPNETDQAKLWANELLNLRREVKESGCTPEVEAAILALLRKIQE